MRCVVLTLDSRIEWRSNSGEGDHVDETGKLKIDTESILKHFGISLSVLLRYSFGGFLAAVIAAIVNRAGTKEFFGALGWELGALASIVVGAGIYAAPQVSG